MGKRSTAVSFNTIPLDEDTEVPLYRQVYDRLRSAILMGQLHPGTRLPSTREMANELSISRNTVMNAYDQLLAEGYIEGQAGSGTFVSRALPDDLLQARISAQRAYKLARHGRELSNRGKVLASTPVAVTPPVSKAKPFVPGTPALNEFPAALWSTLVARHWRDVATRQLDYGDPAGHRPLREAIAAYLGPSRAVKCSPEQIIIVSGTQQALDLAARVLLDPGDVVWIEEYSYRAAQAALIGAGAELVPVPVDQEGLDVTRGPSRKSNVRMAYVTPSHQYPLGITMSLTRRLALLDWAKRTRAWILEDDYDSEYRYVGRPLAALQGLDTEGRVIYLGTFSKVLFPSLRIGYMVVPPDLVEPFAAARGLVGWCSSILDQSVLADFIIEGHFARHIRRMRPLYADRQAALIEAARRECGNRLRIQPDEAGIHITGWLAEGFDDRIVASDAAKQGVVVQPLSGFAIHESDTTRNGLVLGYGAYDIGQINDGIKKLARVLRTSSRRSGKAFRKAS